MTLLERKEAINLDVGPETNPNIGILGGAEYQELSDRVKGFCGQVVDGADVYLHHFETKVLPLIEEKRPSRVIDRAVVKRGLVLDLASLIQQNFCMLVEARVILGGEWYGYEWLMLGRCEPGRQLSPQILESIRTAAESTDRILYQQARQLPRGFCLESIAGIELDDQDTRDLTSLFQQAFTSYLTALHDRDFVQKWPCDPSVRPYVIRHQDGQIVAVSCADLAEVNFDNGRPFRFMEIGDSATDRNYWANGFNRLIKSQLISWGVHQGYDSIHAETRGAWQPPNIGNAKNGMEYCGTLPSNCLISGPEDIEESKDPNLADWAREFGSLNVWALTPVNPNWEIYLNRL